MPLSQGDILRCTLRHKYLGVHDHINVVHLIYDTVATPNTEAAVLEDLGNAFGVAFALAEGLLITRLDAVDIAIYNVTDDTPVGVTSWAGGYTGGTSASEGLPFDDAAVAVFYTGVKRRIGKMYIGGLTESQQDDGQLAGGAISALGDLTAYLLEMDGGANGGIYKYVVWSRKFDTFSLPTTIHIQPVVAQQERRKPGRGS